MIEALVQALEEAELELDAIELADLLWLAAVIEEAKPKARHRTRPPESKNAGMSEATTPGAQPHADRPPAPGVAPESAGRHERHHPVTGMPVPPPIEDESTDARIEGFLAATQALPNALALGRALRPLQRRLPSKQRTVLDVEATVRQFAETQLLIPILQPASEPWFYARLVIDTSPSMVIWRALAEELHDLLAGSGLFRAVDYRELIMGEGGQLRLRTSTGSMIPLGHGQRGDERRITIVVTDCVGEMWRRPDSWNAVAEWGREGPTVLAQMLPRRLWRYTILGDDAVTIRNRKRGGGNAHLRPALPWWELDDLEDEQLVPVFALEEPSVAAWASTVMGMSRKAATAVYVDPDSAAAAPALSAGFTPEERVARFRLSVSKEAYELAVYLSAFELRLPLIRLLHRELIAAPSPSQIAEVLIGGLVHQVSVHDPDADPDSIEYEFVDDTRAILRKALGSDRFLRAFGVIIRHLEKTGVETAHLSMVVSALSGGATDTEIPKKLRPYLEHALPLMQQLGLEQRAVDEPPELVVPAAPGTFQAAVLIEGDADYATSAVSDWLLTSGVDNSRIFTIRASTDTEIQRDLGAVGYTLSELKLSMATVLVVLTGRFDRGLITIGGTLIEFDMIRAFLHAAAQPGDLVMLAIGSRVRNEDLRGMYLSAPRANAVDAPFHRLTVLGVEVISAEVVASVIDGLAGAATDVSQKVTLDSLRRFLLERSAADGRQYDVELVTRDPDFVVNALPEVSPATLEIYLDGISDGFVTVNDNAGNSVAETEVTERVSLELPPGVYEVGHPDASSRFVVLNAGQQAECTLVARLPFAARAFAITIEENGQLGDTARRDGDALESAWFAAGFEVGSRLVPAETTVAMKAIVESLETSDERRGLVWIHVSASWFAVMEKDFHVQLRPGDAEDRESTVPLGFLLRRFQKSPAQSLVLTIEVEKTGVVDDWIEPDDYDVSFLSKDCLVMISTTYGGRFEENSPLAYLAHRALTELEVSSMQALRAQLTAAWHRWADNNDYDRENLLVISNGDLGSLIRDPDAHAEGQARPESFTRVAATDELPAFGLEVISAGTGVCQLLHVADGSDRYAYLIGGGDKATYRGVLRSRLGTLRELGVEFPLIALSHMDDSSSGGILWLLDDLPDRDPPFIGEFWYNDAVALGMDEKSVEHSRRREERLFKSLDRLGIPLNGTFGGRSATWAPGKDAPVIQMPGDVRITLLGPRAELGLRRGVRNRLSMVLLFEHRGYRVLTTGDANGDDIAQALADAGHKRPFHVDVLVLPHHGSPREVTERLLTDVIAKFIVVFPDHRRRLPSAASVVQLDYYRHEYRLHLAQPLDAFASTSDAIGLTNALTGLSGAMITMPETAPSATMIALREAASDETAETSGAAESTDPLPLVDYLRAFCLVLHVADPEGFEGDRSMLAAALGKDLWGQEATSHVQIDLEGDIPRWLKEGVVPYWQSIRDKAAEVWPEIRDTTLEGFLLAVAPHLVSAHERIARESKGTTSVSAFVDEKAAERFKRAFPEAPVEIETSTIGSDFTLRTDLAGVIYMYRELAARLERELGDGAVSELVVRHKDTLLLMHVLDDMKGWYVYMMQNTLEDMQLDFFDFGWHWIDFVIPPWQRGRDEWAQLSLCKGDETEYEFLMQLLDKIERYSRALLELSGPSQTYAWSVDAATYPRIASTTSLQAAPRPAPGTETSARSDTDTETTLSGPLDEWQRTAQALRPEMERFLAERVKAELGTATKD